MCKSKLADSRGNKEAIALRNDLDSAEIYTSGKRQHLHLNRRNALGAGVYPDLPTPDGRSGAACIILP